jgi:hypothetical protein
MDRARAMSPFDLSAGPSSRVGFTPVSGAPDVRWIRPDRPAHLPPPASKAVQERSERANALIVIVLTLACTALAIFDLFLLAAGS